MVVAIFTSRTPSSHTNTAARFRSSWLLAPRFRCPPPPRSTWPPHLPWPRLRSPVGWRCRPSAQRRRLISYQDHQFPSTAPSDLLATRASVGAHSLASGAVPCWHSLPVAVTCPSDQRIQLLPQLSAAWSSVASHTSVPLANLRRQPVFVRTAGPSGAPSGLQESFWGGFQAPFPPAATPLAALNLS